MKYLISINQLTWQHYFPEADFRHAIVLEIIKSLCNSQSSKILKSNDGYTWIANNMIIKEAPMLQYNSKSSLTPIFKRLTEWGLILIRKDDKTNNHYYKLTEQAEMLDRKLEEVESNEQVFKIMNKGVQNNERPRSKKCTYKDTIYKDTNININSNGFSEQIKEIVSYLNDKADTNYKHTTNKTISLITTRLNEGFTIEDFKSVIDKKVDDWLDDEEWAKFLRPETLFGTKFEGYLNQKEKAPQYTSNLKCFN